MNPDRVVVTSRIECAMVFIVVLILYLPLTLLGWYGTPDIQYQWEQVTGQSAWSDWHPVIHTVFIYLASLPCKSLQFVVAVQTVAFAGLAAWFYSAFVRMGFGKGLTVGVIVLAVMNPFSLSCLCTPQKDTLFAMTGLSLTICVMQVLKTHGDWLRGWRIVLLAILLFLASFLRHNGIFYSVPLAAMLPLCVPDRAFRRRAAVCILLGIVLSGIYMVVKASLLDAKKQGMTHERQKFGESIGLPLTIILESSIRHPERVPADVNAFVDRLLGSESVKHAYAGTYNSVKWKSGVRQRMMECNGRRLFDMFLRTVAADPKSAAKVFLHLTSQAWVPLPPTIEFAVIRPGVKDVKASMGDQVYALLSGMIRSPIGVVTSAPGMYLLCIVLSLCHAVFRKGWRVSILAMPFVCYQFGTMLFLAGMDYRFFYITVLCGGAVCLGLLQARSPVSDAAEALD